MKSFLSLVILSLVCLAVPYTYSQGQVYGTYDTRLGDVWGGSVKNENWWFGGGIGGLVMSTASDKATDQAVGSFNSRYSIKPNIDDKISAYNLFAAYFFGEDTENGGLYLGMGYTSIDIDLSSTLTIDSVGTARTTGDFSASTIDLIGGFAYGFTDSVTIDLRAGYGSQSDSKGTIRTRVEGTTDFTQNFKDFELVDEVFFSISVGISF